MNREFDTKVSGIPCICRVDVYHRAKPGRISGDPDDCFPPEPSEFEFSILTRKGKPAKWLEKKLTDDDIQRLEDEWEVTILEDKYNYPEDDYD